ncbi:MAG: hypothetical protein OXN27_17530 [Candidatus Poribacteria bacterium]|nr:hypothetical protein [Candidatus Poribacteria bacterium]
MIFQTRFIAFIFLFAIAPLGCHISNKAATLNKGDDMLVRKLDSILLTVDDLPTMAVDPTMNHRIGGVGKHPRVVDGFEQSWDGTQPEEHIYVKYWLFSSVADAQTAADVWRNFIASAAIEVNGRIESAYQPEPYAAEVIGDATWRTANGASIWFVKNNVLIYVMRRRPEVYQLKFTRMVARKIEAKINAALPKK